MKKTLGIFFAFAMILSLAFIGDALSSNNPLSVQAQTQTRTGQVSVRRKRRGGLVGATARGGRYIYRKGRNGTVYAYRKTKNGTVYVGKKTYQGGKYVGTKTVAGTKYVGEKTVKVTKTVGSKTVSGTKSVFSKTKKVVVGDN